MGTTISVGARNRSRYDDIYEVVTVMILFS